jgi:protein tyrosine phosphatase
LCRYKNILPTKSTLVSLKPLPDLEGDARTQSMFVNANYITGYDGQVKYIATQGPKPETTDAFWRMVWENKVDLITMVTGWCAVILFLRFQQENPHTNSLAIVRRLERGRQVEVLAVLAGSA